MVAASVYFNYVVGGVGGFAAIGTWWIVCEDYCAVALVFRV